MNDDDANVEHIGTYEWYESERERLREAIIEAAKAECAAYCSPSSSNGAWSSNLESAQRALRFKVSALIDFEQRWQFMTTPSRNIHAPEASPHG